MTFVLDCSVAMAWVFPDEASEETSQLRDSLIDDRAFVPSLWPAEVGSVLLAATRRGRVRTNEWPNICASLEALPIEIEPASTPRVWGTTLALAGQHGLSVYDATYLELVSCHTSSVVSESAPRAAAHAGNIRKGRNAAAARGADSRRARPAAPGAASRSAANPAGRADATELV